MINVKMHLPSINIDNDNSCLVIVNPTPGAMAHWVYTPNIKRLLQIQILWRFQAMQNRKKTVTYVRW